MASYSSSALVRRFAQLTGVARGLAAAYQELAERCQADLQLYEAELAQRSRELAAAYMPRLTREDLERGERLTGFRGFSRRDPLKAMEHERAVLEATVRRIEADAQYQRRELLVGPRGDYILEREEAEEHLARLQGECRVYEDHEGFLELIETKYDTPEFEVRFWEGRYWKLWAAGDRIAAALGKDDFGDEVLPAYRELAVQRDQWRAFFAEAEAKVAGLHQLVRQHDEAVARVPRLPQLYLEGCWQMFGEFLASADLPLLEQWLLADGQDGDRAVVMALRRVAGTRAKLEYVREVMQGIRAVVGDLSERARKYARKSQKYARPKYGYGQYGPREADEKFDEKAQKLRERGDNLYRVLARMRSYDDYDRFPLDNDPDLWWREMTGTRPPRLMSTTRAWYDRNPEARARREQERRDRERADQERRVAQATAARAVEPTEGYFS